MCTRLIPFVLVLALVLTDIVNAQDPDLAAHWKFDEGSGTIAFDSTGNGNDGVFVGNPKWVPGHLGGALEFDGDDYLNCGNGPSLQIRDAITIAFWFKVDAFQNQWEAFMTKGNSYQTGRGGGNGDATRMGISGTSAGEGGRGWFRGNVIVTGGQWHHMAATYDGTEAKIYIDGVLDATTPAIGQINEDTYDLYIGENSQSAGSFFHGILDDMRIYSRALRDVEILSIMAGGGTEYPLASGPIPENGSLYADTWINLAWRSGDFAVSHDVYFGDNFDDVNSRAEYTFQGNQIDTLFTAGLPGFPYPDGLVPGTTYYWRIDEVNETEPHSLWKGDVWNLSIVPRTAYFPYPADGAKFVDTEISLSWTAGFGAKLHTVYFGDDLDKVTNAAGGTAQGNTTYTTGALELDHTYYWRVDEFDGAETNKGSVWSFQTLPDIPITDPSLIGWWKFDEGGSIAVDWSGHGNHGIIQGNPQWVIGHDGDALDFDGTGDWVMTDLMPADFGLDGSNPKTVTVWVFTREFNSGGIYDMGSQSTGQEFCLRTKIVDNGWRVQYWSSSLDKDFWYPSLDTWVHFAHIYDGTSTTLYANGEQVHFTNKETLNTANAPFAIGYFVNDLRFRTGFIGIIDDLRLFNKALTQAEVKETMRGDPFRALDPSPIDDSAVNIKDAKPLRWSSGDNALQHDVYFGPDEKVVKNADTSDTSGIYRGRQAVTIYTQYEVEWGGGPYYWRIDEINTDGNISKGSLWNFTVRDFIVIDDFESYNDIIEKEPESNKIFNAWIDGFQDPTNGSIVGYDFAPFAEQVIVHNGRQSMPLFYDNAVRISEATLTLTNQRDWTEEGVGVLSMWFYGDSVNAAEPIYVVLNGIAVVTHDNPNVTQIKRWTEWTIDLQDFVDLGIDLTNVQTIGLGFGYRNYPVLGGSGLVYFDDIRLYLLSP